MPSSGLSCSVPIARSMSSICRNEVRDAAETFSRRRRCQQIRARSNSKSIPRLADAERLLIARVLKLTGGNQSDAARLLDVERHRLRRKIVSYGLEHLARIRPR